MRVETSQCYGDVSVRQRCTEHFLLAADKETGRNSKTLQQDGRCPWGSRESTLAGAIRQKIGIEVQIALVLFPISVTFFSTPYFVKITKTFPTVLYSKHNIIWTRTLDIFNLHIQLPTSVFYNQ